MIGMARQRWETYRFEFVELVEVNPRLDPTCVAPLVANRCIRELLTGVAMRKTGITEKNYLAPETLDHGQG